MTNQLFRRRTLLSASAACVLGASTSSFSEDVQAPPLKPYVEVKPVPGDQAMVRVYFSPNCGYSREYFQFFKNLQATLPKNRQFAFSALVNRGDGVVFSLAFAGVRLYAPMYLNNFVDASLAGAQLHGLHTGSWAGVDQIAKAAHIPFSLPRLILEHQPQVEDAVAHEIIRQHALRITNTPSVAVSGTYIVTPEFTKGDSGLFSQLVNGLVTMTT